MTVEERRGIMGRDGGPRDQFPVGMRVLAVDDDPTCLKLLEALLLKCQYHVTTTNGGITALEMLRGKNDKFDLVISDVHMPDMDGFMLLECVGLDMDLPVIMLSVDGETEAVMKGIHHGACDYLLKPVRIEELRNIWQHVIRRKKFDSRAHNNFDNGEDSKMPHHGNSKGRQGQVMSGSSDHNGRVNRKRKDQNEEEEDDCEENLHENKDPSTQKKPRVIWTVEMHHKFLAAVNQLGLDKAMPKRILDLMNEERITRENVAIHLQKYRLYLKRLSAVANQQANMAAAFGVQNPSYLPVASLDVFGDFHTLAASSQLSALPSFQPNGVLSRTNPNVLGLHGLSPRIVQVGRTHNTTINPINDLSKLQRITIPGNQYGNFLQGIPMASELDQLQQHKRIQEVNNCLPGGFSAAGLATGSSSNSIVSVTNSPILLNTHHSTLGIPSMTADPSDMGAGVSSQLPDLGRCNGTWQSAVPLTAYAANPLPIGSPFSHDGLACSNMRPNVSPIDSQINSNPLNVSSSSAVVAHPNDPLIGRDVQCQANSLGGNMMLMQRGTDKDSYYLNFGSIGDNQKKWGEQSQVHTHEPNIMFSSSVNPTLPQQFIVDPTAHNQRQNNGIYDKRMDKYDWPTKF